MKTRIIKEFDELKSLEPIWDSLLMKSEEPSFFSSWNYINTWWKHFGKEFQLATIVLEEEDRIVGIAPLMVGKGHTRARRAIRHLSFIGQLNDSIPEYQDFFLVNIVDAKSIWKVILENLSKEWDIVHFGVALKEANLFSSLDSPETHYPRNSPYLELAETWDELLSSKSKNFRKKIRNPINRLEKNHEVRFLQAGEDLSIQKAMDILIKLNQQRWGDDSRSFHHESFIAFHRELAHRIAAKGQLALFLLEVDGRFIAAQYDFIFNEKAWGFQGGWDPEWADHAIGRVMIGKCVQKYIEMGLREYDFLAGDAEYKTSWASGVREVSDLQISNPKSGRAKLFNLMQKVRNAAKAA